MTRQYKKLSGMELHLGGTSSPLISSESGIRGKSQQDANLNGRVVRITRQSGAPILIRVSCERVILRLVTCEMFKWENQMRSEPGNHGTNAQAVNEIADSWAAVIMDLAVKEDATGEREADNLNERETRFLSDDSLEN